MPPPRRRREERPRQRDSEYEEIVVKIRRCAKVVKGGKRFSFNAMVVIGDRKGKVGWGHAKANEVPIAIEKAIKDARKGIVRVSVVRSTIPHRIVHKFAATEIMMRPACLGTGIKAGAAARAVLELAGVQNVLCKVAGSSNPVNVAKATLEALRLLRTKPAIEKLRGVPAVEPKAPVAAAPAGGAP